VSNARPCGAIRTSLAPKRIIRDNVFVPQLRTPPRLHGLDYSASRVFFVTFCVWDRLPTLARPGAAAIVRDVIFRYRERQWYWLLCYCVMPDHVHLLIKLRSSCRSLSRVVATLKHETVKSSRRSGGAIRWQFGYHDRILRRCDAEFEIARYILRNPIRAGISREGEVYPWAQIVDQFW
jgi:putative transposase